MHSTQKKKLDTASLPISDEELRKLFSEDREWENLYRVDATTATREQIQPDIGNEIAHLLRVLAPMVRPRRALDLGTNLGYSARILAELFHDGEVISVEHRAELAERARSNLQHDGIEDRVNILVGNAFDRIEELEDTFGLILLDVDKRDYAKLLNPILSKLDSNGLLLVDDVGFLSREFSPEQRHHLESMANFVNVLFEKDDLEIAYLPIGNGLLLCRHKQQD